VITRIEIDGFKSFVDFSLDLHPFTAVIGTNASGKSNLLDAFRFLSAAVKGDISDAVGAVRGDAVSLFHQFSDGSRVDRMRFAVELLVQSRIEPGEDLFDLEPTRWRYELEVRLVKRGLEVAAERMQTVRDEQWFTFVGASPAWRAAHARFGIVKPVALRRNSRTRRLVVDRDFDRLLADPVSDLAGTRSCGFETAALRQTSRTGELPDMLPDGTGRHRRGLPRGIRPCDQGRALRPDRGARRS
jgi:hypothetical protein